jgi:hypothetical protein
MESGLQRGARAFAMTRPTNVDEYLDRLPLEQRELASVLRRAILSSGRQLHESIKWAQPVYESNGPVCYFKAHSRHVTFGLWRGASLLDMDPRLETSGSKMAHMKLVSRDDVNQETIRKLVSAAVALNH